MIDFSQISTGENFELLCEDLLQAMGYTLESTVSRGPDLGRDIIVSKRVRDEMNFDDDYRYLIECKHYAKSGRSVQEVDIGNPIARMGTHNCNRYILITSTVPSEKVRRQLESICNIVPSYKATVWAKNLLVRFLEQHPEIWQRHVSLALITGTPVRTLAGEVERWLEAMGYVVSPGQPLAADQAEITAIMDKGMIHQRLLIRCLDGEADAKRLHSLLEATRDEGFSEGWAIADQRVAPSAREFADGTSSLRVFNLSEFMQLIFGPYFTALGHLVEQSRIPDYYVDLGCYKLIGGGEEHESDLERHSIIDDYIDDWLRERGKMHISILGEFGTGKTWFCRHYAHRQLHRYLADPVHERLPLLITLRDFTKAVTVRQLINDALLEKYKLPLLGSAYDVFDRMSRQGKLLLILDGFDEMARKVDYQTVVDNFWELANVVVDGSKVLLTCRTEFFRYAQESERVLHGEEHGRATIMLDPVKFEVLYLEPFSDAQIEEAIQRRASEPEGRRTARRILNTPHLADLARKPVLVELLLAALQETGAEALTNPAQVYLHATNALLMRNIETRRTFTSTADKLFFLCELAWEMIREDKLRIHYREIPERIKRWFSEKVTSSEIDHWDFDLRNQTLLQRNAIGEYEFAHKTLAEYFVAFKFAAELGSLSQEYQDVYCEADGLPCEVPIRPKQIEELAKTFGSLPLSGQGLIAVAVLLKWLIGNRERLWTLIQDTRQRASEEVGHVGGNAATVLNHLGESFNGARLEGTNLADADLTNADMSTANLCGTVLHGAQLTNATLTRADLRGADLRDLRIDELGEIRSLATAPSQSIFACGGAQGTEKRGFVKLCDWNRGVWLPALSLQAGRVLSLAYSPSGRHLACGTDDGTVVVWNAMTGEKILSRQLDAYIAKLTWSPEKSWLVVSKGPTASASVEVWAIPSGRILQRYTGHGIGVSAAAVLPGGQQVISCDFRGCIRLWELTSQKTLCEVQAAAGKWSRDMVINRDGDRVAFGRLQGNLALADLPTLKRLVDLEDSSETFTCLQFISSGHWIAGCNDQGVAKVWDTDSGALVYTLPEVNDAVSICFAHGSERLLMALRTGCVKVWDTSSDPWQPVKMLEQRLNCQDAMIGGESSRGLDQLRDGIPLGNWFLQRGAVYADS